MLWVIVSLSCLSLVLCEENVRKSYDGYQVLDIIPKSDDQVKYLRELMISTDYLDFWQEPSRAGQNATVMVPPGRYRQLSVALRKEDIYFEQAIANVQTLLEPMWKDLDKKEKAFNLNDFNTLTDIYSWMLDLATRCRPGLQCQVYSAGNSHNGNSIMIFRISRTGANRRAYWLDATIHAREWLAPATLVNILNNLATGTSANAVRLTDRHDWYIMPVMNPDGYSYTFTNERLWRKNRRPNSGSTCFGTDLNRNFDFRWGREGVSHSPCSETFCGPSGGSEPETQHVQNELRRLGPSILAAVTIHTYGNMWMFPWGNTVNHAGSVCERASDHAELMRVSDLTANAIQNTYNTRWARGNSCEVIYTTTGGTDDYAKGVAGIKYAFCPELRGNNFVIASSQIALSYNEVWNGVVAMVDAING